MNSFQNSANENSDNGKIPIPSKETALADVVSSGNPVQKEEGGSLSLEDFFENCRRIGDSGQVIFAILKDMSFFKEKMSNALKCQISTQEELEAGFETIEPLLDFWIKYGDSFSAIIKGPDDAVELIERYNNYPQKKAEIAELNNELVRRQRLIEELQESEINKRLEEANSEICRLNEELKSCQDKVVQLNELLTASQKEVTDAKLQISALETEKEGLLKETNNLGDKLKQEQSERERAENDYRSMVEKFDNLEKQIPGYRMIRDLLVDAFRIDIDSETEFTKAIAITNKIICACLDLARDRSLEEGVIGKIKDAVATSDKNKKLEADIHEKEREILKDKSEISSISEELNRYKRNCEDLSRTEAELRAQKAAYLASLSVRDKIIQCFAISNYIKAIVEGIEDEDNNLGDLGKLREIIGQIYDQMIVW